MASVTRAAELLAAGADPDVIAAQFAAMPTTPPAGFSLSADGIDSRDISQLVLLRQSPPNRGTLRRDLAQPLVACWNGSLLSESALRGASEGDACVDGYDAALLAHTVTYHCSPGQPRLTDSVGRRRGPWSFR